MLDWSGESHELLQAKEVDTVNAQLNFGDARCCEVMLATSRLYIILSPQLGPRHTGCLDRQTLSGEQMPPALGISFHPVTPELISCLF